MDQKPSKIEAQGGVPHGPVGEKIEKKRRPEVTQQKKGAEPHRAAPFSPKKWPTWLQVGLQNRSKIDKKSMQKSIVFLMPLGVDLWDFCFQNEAKLGPKWDQKSM